MTVDPRVDPRSAEPFRAGRLADLVGDRADRVASELVARARRAAPREACGWVHRSGRVVEAGNLASDGEQTFRMAPADARRLERLLSTGFVDAPVALWHSHPAPGAPEGLSDADLRGAASLFPGLAQIVVDPRDLEAGDDLAVARTSAAEDDPPARTWERDRARCRVYLRS